MKRLGIDFAAPGWRQLLHRSTPRTWVVAAAALLLCAVASLLGTRLVDQMGRDQATLNAALLRANKPVVRSAAAAPVIPEQQAAAVNGAIMQLNLPWRSLHDAIGAATPPSIALLALEPDARKRTMRLTAEAKSSDAMITYIESLKEQGLFASVMLTRHEINEQDPNRPIRFQIDAEWSAP